jgi:hypothetical protein
LTRLRRWSYWTYSSSLLKCWWSMMTIELIAIAIVIGIATKYEILRHVSVVAVRSVAVSCHQCPTVAA